MPSNLSRSVFNDDDPLTRLTRPTSRHYEAGTGGYEDNLRETAEVVRNLQNSSKIPAGVQRTIPASPGVGQPIPTFDPSNIFNGGGK